MKLESTTQKILKNFQNINSSILIKATPEGQNKTRLRVLKSDKLIYAETLIPEVFEHNVALYNVPMFMNLVSGMGDPDITFNDTHAILKQGKTSSRIIYASEDVIMHPSKDYQISDIDASFELDETSRSNLLNAAKIMNLDTLRLFSKDGKTYFQALDPKNESTNTFEVEVDCKELAKDYYFDTEFMTVLMNGDYTISVTDSAGIFEHKAEPDLKYILAQKTDVENDNE